MTLLDIVICMVAGGMVGWMLRDVKAEVDADRAWWADRPHIEGIECPPEADCGICTGGPA